ncbi:LysR family transcriptional regulator [Kocuria sp. M1R5S2]
MPISARLPALDELETAHLAARLGSVGAAARALGISQQAASRRIRAVETRLGLALFARSPRGVTTTARGAPVMEWIGDLLRAAENLSEGVATVAGRGHATVATSMTVAEYVLPAWIMALRVRHPELEVSVTTGNSAEVIAAVLSDEVQLGFVEGPAVPSTLERLPFAEDELVLVVPPGHPWARRTGIPPEELRRTPLVLREAGSGTRQTLEAALPGLVPPLVELGTTAAVKAAALAGNRPTVLSRLAVRHELDDGRLVAVPVEGLDLTRSLQVVRRPDRPVRGAAAELLDVVLRHGGAGRRC